MEEGSLRLLRTVERRGLGRGQALHAAEWPHARGDVVKDDPRPRRVVVEAVVVLGRDLVELVQPRPRDPREVVVLVVVPDAVGDQVQRAVVGVRLLARVEGVVLSDEVPGHGVQPAPKEAARHEVKESLPAHQPKDGGIKRDAGDDVNHVPARERQRVEDHRPEGIECELQQHPYQFQGTVGDHVSLGFAWHIHVNSINPKPSVVVTVIFLKFHSERYAYREICEYHGEFVVHRFLKSEIVR
mmetsp:Transcript_8718/g.21037  ORF Transcript_8718/g.21037 Transcript_8718/m.21037 type:complete len:242 (-) Transcript_8718:369-1094(-)